MLGNSGKLHLTHSLHFQTNVSYTTVYICIIGDSEACGIKLFILCDFPIIVIQSLSDYSKE
jgi:hypothetical protein